MSQYHTGASWTVPGYAPFDLNLASALEALAGLGYTAAPPEIAKARDDPISHPRQLAAGRWTARE